MSLTTQQYIDDLILFIENTEDPESVTNEIVAAVLDYLNRQCLANKSGYSEIAEQIVILIKQIKALQTRLDTVEVDSATDAIQKVEALRNDVGILSFVGILEHATDLIRSGLDGVYYCSWDGVFRQITPNEEDPTIVGRVVAVPEYNRMDGDRAVHASEQKLFRLGNRLYGYDAGSNMLRVLGYEGDGGGSGSGDGAPAITTDEIDSLIDRATADDNEN